MNHLYISLEYPLVIIEHILCCVCPVVARDMQYFVYIQCLHSISHSSALVVVTSVAITTMLYKFHATSCHLPGLPVVLLFPTRWDTNWTLILIFIGYSTETSSWCSGNILLITKTTKPQCGTNGTSESYWTHLLPWVSGLICTYSANVTSSCTSFLT